MAPTATATSSGASATGASATPTAAGGAGAAGSSSSTANAPGSLEEATQRYQATKLALRTGLANKRIIDRSLIDLESQIYLFEGSYLQSTASSGGNIVKGFDAYLKNSSASAGGRGSSSSNAANAGDIPIEDRIFSLSSATYQKSLELKANEGLEQQQQQQQEERESATNTPKPTTTSRGGADADANGATPTGKKSKKDKEAAATTAAATPAAKEGGTLKKKKDKDAKEKERSATPQVKSGGGKNADTASAGGGTPTKSTPAGGGKAGATATTKLKRKNTDGAAGTPSGKAVKRKKDDD